MSNFSFGSDPEFMLEKNGKVCSAIGILKGDKDSKTKIKNFEFYYDNVLAECTIPPTTSKNDAIQTFKECLKTLSELIKPYKIIIKSAHTYDKDQFYHEDAYKVYCVSEYCCYSMQELEQDEELFQKIDLRSAGGHIHIGHPDIKKKYNRWMIARLMDLHLGIPSVFLDNNPASLKRKEIYGKAGRCRFPDYGIEYRSLSNFWLKSPKTVGFVFNCCEKIVSLIENDEWQNFWSVDETMLADPKNWKDKTFDIAKCHYAIYDSNLLQKAINTNNKEIASEFTKLLPKELYEEMKELENTSFKTLEEEWQL